MAFSIHRTATTGMEVWRLESSAGDIAEVCPLLGFNCYRWIIGDWDALYADSQFLAGSPPTRSGIPILFPFPNRIRDGRFRWKGKEFQLPLNDPALKNAIHGFPVRRAWRVLETGTDEHSAWMTGEFQGNIDAKDCIELWPADYQIRVTHRLRHLHLTTTAVIDNPGGEPMPFGLGYHHYFRVHPDDRIVANAEKMWVLEENLPTGERKPVDDRCDLRSARKFVDVQVDDVLSDLRGERDADGLCLRASIKRGERTLQMLTSPDFRELVVYTPPHRQAIAIEPYTCTTDAINLQQRGVDAGLRTLNPGESWMGIIELKLAT